MPPVALLSSSGCGRTTSSRTPFAAIGVLLVGPSFGHGARSTRGRGRVLCAPWPAREIRRQVAGQEQADAGRHGEVEVRVLAEAGERTAACDQQGAGGDEQYREVRAPPAAL